MDAGELISNGLDQQRGNNRRVNAAGKSQQHLAIAHLGTHGLNGFFDECVGQFGSVDARHIVGALVGSEIHVGSFS